MRTGTCKYGTTCKFNHPHPSSSVSGVPLSMSNSPNFPGTGVGSAFPAAQLYHPGFNQLWPIPPARLPLMPSPRSSGQPSFSPMVLPGAPQNLMHLPSPGWNTYQVTYFAVLVFRSSPLYVRSLRTSDHMSK